MTPATFTISADHPCLPGHFPGQPVVPGVVILDAVLEALEQQAGPLAATRWPQVKFLQPMLPGQSARITLEPLADGRWRFRVSTDAALIASGEVARA